MIFSKCPQQIAFWLQGTKITSVGLCLTDHGRLFSLVLERICPRDGGAWWAAVYGVAQSRTRLKQLTSTGEDLKRKLSL